MLAMQEDSKLRSYGLALSRDRFLKETILYVVRQMAPYPNDSLA